MLLYDYFRSSASYRVRIALNLKGLEFDKIEIHLLKDGGEQHKEPYISLNPQQLVPALTLDSGTLLTQSMAIIEYLEENYPQSSKLLPLKIEERAYIRSLSQMICCDIHPLNNLRVLQYLVDQVHISEEQKKEWYRYWIDEGFTAVEKRLKKSHSNGKFCFGETPTMADCCLIPQVYNALRFQIALKNYPLINEIYNHCQTLDSFLKAEPKE